MLNYLCAGERNKILIVLQQKLLRKQQKKADLLEVQLNGGTIEDKVKWAVQHLEKRVPIASVFEQNEMIDVIGATKGHGRKGKQLNLAPLILFPNHYLVAERS